MIGGSWDPASISALAAIFGSLSGALASSVGTWITQRHQDRRVFWPREFFTASSCIQTLSAKARTSWLMPSNIVFTIQISSARPTHS